ncbi:MAG: DUF4157 domain-containing protein [Acidimicrobiia bacterium]|nr:DUF4157 domain-containing protein [Acidimicrobiia bacterium]
MTWVSRESVPDAVGDLARHDTGVGAKVRAGLDRDPVVLVCTGPAARCLVPPAAAAWTLGRIVLVREGAWEPASKATQLLIAHECVHVAQWYERGRLRFLARYLADYARGRLRGLGHDAAYRAIRAEEEAYAVQGRLAAVAEKW